MLHSELPAVCAGLPSLSPNLGCRHPRPRRGAQAPQKPDVGAAAAAEAARTGAAAGSGGVGPGGARRRHWEGGRILPGPGRTPRVTGQPVPAGGCGVSKLRCWALPGTVRAPRIALLLLHEHGRLGSAPRSGRGEAGRPPPLFSCPWGTGAATVAAANMAGACWALAKGWTDGAGRAAGLPGGLWPWSPCPRPGSGGVKGQGRCRGPQRCRTSWLHGRLCYPEECAPRRRGGGSGPRSPAPPGAQGGAGRGGGRRAGGGCGGGARTALFATDACARCWRISHFSKSPAPGKAVATITAAAAGQARCLRSGAAIAVPGLAPPSGEATVDFRGTFFHQEAFDKMEGELWVSR